MYLWKKEAPHFICWLPLLQNPLWPSSHFNTFLEMCLRLCLSLFSKMHMKQKTQQKNISCVDISFVLIPTESHWVSLKLCQKTSRKLLVSVWERQRFPKLLSCPTSSSDVPAPSDRVFGGVRCGLRCGLCSLYFQTLWGWRSGEFDRSVTSRFHFAHWCHRSCTLMARLFRT